MPIRRRHKNNEDIDMSEQIKVSVVMPVYNGAAYIKQAIDSALGQQISIEVLVIDDQSTDSLPEVLAGYAADGRVRWIRNEENLGVARSRNYGVANAKGEYIAFLDADDWWSKGKLTKQIAEMERQQAVMSTTARDLMRPDGSFSGRTIPVKTRITYHELLKHNSVSTSSVVVRRDVMLHYPMEHDDSHEDYITWLKIAREYGWVLGINEPLLQYRLSEGSKSRNKWKSAWMTFKVYRYAGLSIPHSFICFVSYAVHGILKYYGRAGKHR